jgi:uncharacterized phiE125 gp8 family phage protein
MGYRLITPPVLEPLTLAEIKADMRIDHASDDATLTRNMAEAREWIERRLQTKLLTQTWEYIFDAFPTNEIRLPFGPVQSIVQIAYDDGLGVEQILSEGDYYLDDASYQVNHQPWVFPTAGWPVTLDAINAVRIRFVAGYVTAAEVAPSVRAAFRLKVRELFDGDDTAMQVNNMLMNYDLLLA